MKILALADLHLNNWTAHSKLDDHGVPDRLTDYLKLAEALRDTAVKEKVDCIVIAGDIFQSSVARPMVLNVGGRFFNTLAQAGCKILVTIGQHDSDSKSQIESPIHSIVSAINIAGVDNIHYFIEPGVIEVAGVDFIVAPWKRNDYNIAELPDADVFVGHGMISSCKDVHGYQFISGYDKDELLAKYKLTVIGDIHHKQTFSGNQSKVLIPGAPVQNTFKDDPDCGVWICEIPDDKSKVDLKFLSTHELVPDTFHKFLYTDDVDKKDTPLEHYKVRALKSDKDSGVTFDNNVEYNLLELTQKFSHADMPDSKETIDEVLKTAYDNMESSSGAVPSAIEPKRLSINNFLSIDTVDFDFERMPNDVAFIGENGSGKTNFAEALYWVLTGSFTKNIPIANIGNKYLSGKPQVEFEFARKEQVYVIQRGRDKGTYLHLYEKIDGKLVEQTAGDIKTTQARIMDLIGITASDILIFCYFSTNALTTFGNLGGSDKNELLGKIVGIDDVSDLAESCKAIHDKKFAETQDASSKVSLLKDQVVEKQSKLEQLQSLSQQDITKQLEEKLLAEVKQKIQQEIKVSLNGDTLEVVKAKLNTALTNTKSAIDSDGIDNAKSKVDELTNSELEITKKLTTSKTNVTTEELSVKQNEANIEKLKEGKCYACGQPTLDETMLDKFVTDNKNLALTIDAGKNRVKVLTENLEEIKTEKISLSAKLEEMNSKVQLSNKILEIVNYLQREEKSINEKTDDFKADIKQVKSDIANIKKQGTEYYNVVKSNEETIAVSKKIYSNILSKRGGVIQELTKIACESVATEVNSLMDSDDVKLRVVTGKDPNIHVKFRGRKNEVVLGEMSGGERRVVDILIMVALSNIFSKRFNLENGILGFSCFDEIFTFLDETYSDLAFGALAQCMSKHRFVISHDPRITSYIDRSIHVQNIKGISKYDFKF